MDDRLRMKADRWLEHARDKFDEGDYFEAKKLLDNAIQFESDMTEARKLRALTYIHTGDFEKAKEEYEYLTEKEATVEIRLRYGGVLLVLEQPENAKEEFSAVLKQEPDNLNAKKGVADAYFQLHNFFDAQRIYDEILEETPEDAYIWYAKAETYYRAQDHEKAVETIEKAISLQPAPEFFAFKGDFFIRHENFERALEQYVLAAKMAPNDAEIQLRLGFIYRILDRLKDALAAFSDALRLNPYMVEALENKVEVLNALNRKDQAINTMKQLIQLEPKDERRTMELAQYYMDQKKFEKAITYFDLTVKHHEDNSEAWYGKAYSHYQLEQHPLALHSVEKAIEREINPAGLLELREKIEQELNRDQ